MTDPVLVHEYKTLRMTTYKWAIVRKEAYLEELVSHCQSCMYRIHWRPMPEGAPISLDYKDPVTGR